MDSRSPQELLAAWLAGELDPASTAQLLDLCRDQPEVLDEAARLQCLDRLLRAALLDAGPDAFVAEVAARCGISDPQADLVARVKWRVSWRRWAVYAAAACLVIAAGVFGAWRLRAVAVVDRLESAQWGEGERVLRVGEKLRRGRFALSRGFVALRFDRGAELLVEGPAELDLVSSNRVGLRSGRAFANVPEAAIGFTVEGPTGRVVDKGTAFAVQVGDSGMEVHVLKGLVEAGRGSHLQPVRENQALKMSALAVNSIPADGDRFLTELPPKAAHPVGWVHWAFDENAGATTQTETSGIASREPATLSTLRADSSGPQWTTGQFGSALRLDGEDDYVQTDFPGISGDTPRTVAFWVKVPRDFTVKNGYSIVSWGSADAEGEALQISINPKADFGALGRIRVGRIGEPIIGTTDLRDDRWHHVAVILYGGDMPQHSTQVMLYIDGELEPTLRKGMPIVRTNIASANARKVAFGLNIDPRNPDPSRPGEWRVFRGCIDELFICDAALNQAQVRELMARNRADGFAPEISR
jgi:hypothetical protein